MTSHRERVVAIKVIDRDAVFPHDVAALVTLTDEGRTTLIARLTDLKSGDEFTVGDGEWNNIAFRLVVEERGKA